MAILVVSFRRSVIIAELWWPEVARPKICRGFFLLFWKKTPYDKIFKILFPIFFTLTPIDVVVLKFREIWPTGNRRNRALFTRPNNVACLSNCHYCADRAQNLPGPTPSNVSECSRFHPNRFTFDRVIAERVNTAKSPRKVNPIFGWSLASSRIRIRTNIKNWRLRYREISEWINSSSLKACAWNWMQRTQKEISGSCFT